MIRRLFAAGLAAALPLLALAAHAQGLNLGDGETPLEVYADDGIEWQQDKLIILARGNAKAVRGEVTVLGEQLTAFYKEKADGSTDVYRLDADGNVRILSRDGEVTGEKAVFDVIKSILVVTGPTPTLTTPKQVVTAAQQLEYWEAKQMAVARGGAAAKEPGRTLKGEVLTAFFRETKKGVTEIYRMEAFENVEVITGRDKAYGDYGDYDVGNGVATLTGKVRIHRGKNMLTGCKTQVNLNTGVSRLFSCPPGAGGRTKGILVPKNRKQN